MDTNSAVSTNIDGGHEQKPLGVRWFTLHERSGDGRHVRRVQT